MDHRPCISCLVFASSIVAKLLANSNSPLPDFCDIRFRSSTRSSCFHLSFCPFYSPFLISPLLFIRAFAKTSCRWFGKTRCFSFLKLSPLIDRLRIWRFLHGRISRLRLRCGRKKISETSAINQEIGYGKDFEGKVKANSRSRVGWTA